MYVDGCLVCTSSWHWCTGEVAPRVVNGHGVERVRGCTRRESPWVAVTSGVNSRVNKYFLSVSCLLIRSSGSLGHFAAQ